MDKERDEISSQQLELISARLESLLAFDRQYYESQSDAILWDLKSKFIDLIWPLRGKRLGKSSLPLVAILLFGFAVISISFFPAIKFPIVVVCCLGTLFAYYLESRDRERLQEARHHLEAIDKVLAQRGLPVGCDSTQLFDFLSAKEPS